MKLKVKYDSGLVYQCPHDLTVMVGSSYCTRNCPHQMMNRDNHSIDCEKIRSLGPLISAHCHKLKFKCKCCNERFSADSTIVLGDMLLCPHCGTKTDERIYEWLSADTNEGADFLHEISNK